MYLLITLEEVKWLKDDDVISIRLEKAPCPYRLLPDTDNALDELFDRIKQGGIVIVRRLDKIMIDPVRLGLNHNDYVSHYSRPVQLWVGYRDSRRLRVGRLGGRVFGYDSYSCQASVLLVNRILERLGSRVRLN